MATPHVAGVAALLKAQDPGRDWRAIRNLLLTSGDTVPALAETVTGKRLNARNALTCVGAEVEARLRPLYRSITVAPGQAVPVAVLHAVCADPAGDVAVDVAPGVPFTLHDDGTSSDQVAGDGVYSGEWIAPAIGTYTLTVAGEEVIVHVGNALPNPAPVSGGLYGFALATSDDTIAVGEIFGSDDGSHSGRVHLLAGISGAPLRTFVNPSPDLGDDFGFSIAMEGNLLLVGAPFDDTFGDDVGIAYLFDTMTGALLQTFTNPTGSADGNFGWAVAFVEGRVLVGAPSDTVAPLDSGAAYLFEAFSGALLHTFHSPGAVGGDAFGYTLAARGGHAVIGAPGEEYLFGYGGAYVMDADPSSPTFGDEVLPLHAEPAGYSISQLFGSSIAVVGNDFVVGDPLATVNKPAGYEGPGIGPPNGVAYLLDGTTGAVKHEIQLPEWDGFLPHFGWALAVDDDYILVTAQYEIVTPATGVPLGFAGAAYLVEAATGAPVRRFTHPAPHRNDQFGYAAAAIGEDFIVAAIGDDAVGLDAGMVYRLSAPAPVSRSKCYKTKATPKLPSTNHTLADAIETKVTVVQGVAGTCGPASQSGTPIADAGAYLTCRKIKDAAGQPKLVAQDLQLLGALGLERLTLKKARSLCLASGRDGSLISASLDHYKCYQAKTTKGAPKFVKRTIALADEIESKNVSVAKPVAVCVPVAVDGSAIVVLRHDAHVLPNQGRRRSGGVSAPVLRRDEPRGH